MPRERKKVTPGLFSLFLSGGILRGKRSTFFLLLGIRRHLNNYYRVVQIKASYIGQQQKTDKGNAYYTP
jgi:hypothetical protein